MRRRLGGFPHSSRHPDWRVVYAAARALGRCQHADYIDVYVLDDVAPCAGARWQWQSTHFGLTERRHKRDRHTVTARVQNPSGLLIGINHGEFGGPPARRSHGHGLNWSRPLRRMERPEVVVFNDQRILGLATCKGTAPSDVHWNRRELSDPSGRREHSPGGLPPHPGTVDLPRGNAQSRGRTDERGPPLWSRRIAGIDVRCACGRW
jgi:hypothetical protein